MSNLSASPSSLVVGRRTGWNTLVFVLKSPTILVESFTDERVLNCDSRTVTCPLATPECGEGAVPVVDESGNCWTGACAPIEQCFWVTGCDDCADHQACVQYAVRTGPRHICVDIPADCGDTPTCDCMESEACDEVWAWCSESDAVISVFTPMKRGRP